MAHFATLTPSRHYQPSLLSCLDDLDTGRSDGEETERVPADSWMHLQQDHKDAVARLEKAFS